MGLVAGIDVGSTTTKVVVMESASGGSKITPSPFVKAKSSFPSFENGELKIIPSPIVKANSSFSPFEKGGLRGIVGSKVAATGTNCRRTATTLLESVLDDAGVKSTFTGRTFCETLDYVVSTGYGRRLIDFSNEAVTEISANVKGASWLMTQCNDSLNGSKIRTLINIGGQDCKVISLDNNGIMKDFAMNDKCAAGTGRFLEVMSCILEVELERLGAVSLKAKDPLPINSLCTVFGESEVISLLSQGKSVEDIAAGIHRSIAKRINAMVRKVGLHEAVFFDGGPALNEGLRFALEQELGTKAFVPPEPQIVTAIGAAIIANDLSKKAHSKTPLLLFPPLAKVPLHPPL